MEQQVYGSPAACPLATKPMNLLHSFVLMASGGKKNFRTLSKSTVVACHPFRSVHPGCFGQNGGTDVRHYHQIFNPRASLVPCGLLGWHFMEHFRSGSICGIDHGD
jgi:hypothetical protein